MATLESPSLIKNVNLLVPMDCTQVELKLKTDSEYLQSTCEGAQLEQTMHKAAGHSQADEEIWLTSRNERKKKGRKIYNICGTPHIIHGECYNSVQ